jgi:hypothetical protein
MAARTPVATGQNRHFAPSSSPAAKSPPLTKGGPHCNSKEGSLSQEPRQGHRQANSPWRVLRRGEPPSPHPQESRSSTPPRKGPRSWQLHRGHHRVVPLWGLPHHADPTSNSQIQPVCILGRSRDIMPHRLGGGTAPVCLLETSSGCPSVGGATATTSRAPVPEAFTIAAHPLYAHK